MTAVPLDYSCSGSQRPRRRWVWRVLAAVGLLLGGSAVPSLPVKAVESRMDAVTGSMTWTTVWICGITDGPHLVPSPLELHLRRSGIAWTPSWQFLHNTHRTLFGNATCYECSSAPPISQIHSALKEFAGASTDAELREFVRVMQTGTDAEQEVAVKAAGDKALDKLAKEP